MSNQPERPIVAPSVPRMTRSIATAEPLPNTSGEPLGVKVDDEVRNPSWWWATVRNPNGIPNGNHRFPYGDTGGVESGALLTVRAIVGTLLLVEISGVGLTYGTPLPDGAIIDMTEEQFARMTGVYDRLVGQRESERERVMEALNDL